MTILASTTDFTTGAVLSWAIPIVLVFAVLLWWGGVLTARAFKARQGDAEDVSLWRRLSTSGRAAVVIAAAAALGIAAGLTAHLLFSPEAARPAGPPLPELHGQATWAAGERRAPRFRLHDVLGGTTSLAAMRGRTTLITFLDSQCRQLCPLVGRAIGDVQRALPASARPAVLVVSVDPKGDTAASVRSAARRWRLEPGWRWLSGTRPQLAAVWREYGIVVRPMTNDIVHGSAVYLVDAVGNERAGYLSPLLPNFIALDVRRVEADTSS